MIEQVIATVPFIPGHEATGTVVLAGPDSTVKVPYSHGHGPGASGQLLTKRNQYVVDLCCVAFGDETLRALLF